MKKVTKTAEVTKAAPVKTKKVFKVKKASDAATASEKADEKKKPGKVKEASKVEKPLKGEKKAKASKEAKYKYPKDCADSLSRKKFRHEARTKLKSLEKSLGKETKGTKGFKTISAEIDAFKEEYYLS